MVPDLVQQFLLDRLKAEEQRLAKLRDEKATIDTAIAAGEAYLQALRIVAEGEKLRPTIDYAVRPNGEVVTAKVALPPKPAAVKHREKGHVPKDSQTLDCLDLHEGQWLSTTAIDQFMGWKHPAAARSVYNLVKQGKIQRRGSFGAYEYRGVR